MRDMFWLRGSKCCTLVLRNGSIMQDYFRQGKTMLSEEAKDKLRASLDKVHEMCIRDRDNVAASSFFRFAIATVSI